MTPAERVARAIWEVPLNYHGEPCQRISWASLLEMAHEGDPSAIQNVQETRAEAAAAMRETLLIAAEEKRASAREHHNNGNHTWGAADDAAADWLKGQADG